MYHAEDTDQAVNAVVQNDSIWATQKSMAELFDVDRTVMAKHINNIYSEGELEKESTCAKIALVQKEGNRNVKCNVDFYNLDCLDAIISVGCCVNSRKADDKQLYEVFNV